MKIIDYLIGFILISLIILFGIFSLICGVIFILRSFEDLRNFFIGLFAITIGTILLMVFGTALFNIDELIGNR